MSDPARDPGPVLGLDIGGTKLAVGMVGPDGHVSGLQVEPTQRERGPADVVRRLFRMGHTAIKASASTMLPTAVGISCGGPLDPLRGVLHSPPHLPGWDAVPISELARAEFGVPSALQNDATAAALAEYRYGAGRGERNLLYLTLSTGVGGGAVVDGQLMRGATGNGGEIGHVMVAPGGRLCSCGRRGCLEAYCSGTSIGARAREAVSASPRGILAGLDHPITSTDVAAGVRAGDALSTEIWDLTVELLGVALTDLVNIFEPETLVLGGGVTRSGDLLLDRLSRIVADGAMPPAARTVQLHLAQLGDIVGVVGAGAIAFDRLTAIEESHVH